MVLLNRIYTRTGDAGRTRLADGSEVAKTDLRVETYGAVDETNACIGLARLHTSGDPELDPVLQRIQNDLFDLGADLARPQVEGEDQIGFAADNLHYDSESDVVVARRTSEA